MHTFVIHSDLNRKFGILTIIKLKQLKPIGNYSINMVK